MRWNDSSWSGYQSQWKVMAEAIFRESVLRGITDLVAPLHLLPAFVSLH